MAGTYARTLRSSSSDPSTIPFAKPVMLGRRQSSSISSMEGPYHALPQTPDMAQDINIPSAIVEAELASDDIEDAIGDDTTPFDAPVDSRIQWIHFMLGAAVLLPWNGESYSRPTSGPCKLILLVVMITAEPYFLSQLRHSSVRSTFGSYLATTFMLSNFFFLAHATITSKKVRPYHNAHLSVNCSARGTGSPC